MDTPARAVSGLTPSAKTLFVAAAAHAMPHGAVVYVVPGDGDLDQAVADVAFFVSALEGLSDAVAERTILPFPSHEIDPYRGMAPHFGVQAARARVLHALARGTARVVVASAAALMPRVSAPDRLLAASIDLRPGQDIGPADLAALLVDAGFSREDPADEHGEFARRGGILDVYPAGEAEPVRIEFIGDTIESMRTYDPATQRSHKPIDQLTIVSLTDVLTAVAKADAGAEGDAALDRSATVFDYLARVRDRRLIVSEWDEVDANGLKLAEQIARSYDEAATRRPGGAAAARPSELVIAWEEVADRKSTRLNSSHIQKSRMPSSA